MNETRPGQQGLPPQSPQIRPLGTGTLHPSVPPAPQRAGIAPPPMRPLPVSSEDDSISLVEEAPVEQLTAAPAPKKIVAFGIQAAHAARTYKRVPYSDGKGACRVKSFHAKYSEQGLEHMDDMVNEWLDAHPEIEVKFTNTTVHVFEGKIREPAIVLNVWY